MKYDWDKSKAISNIESHDVTFEEATLVFTDEWAIEEYDDSHSEVEEKRFTIIGLAETRLLRVTYTVENDEINRNKFDW